MPGLRSGRLRRADQDVRGPRVTGAQVADASRSQGGVPAGSKGLALEGVPGRERGQGLGQRLVVVRVRGIQLGELLTDACQQQHPVVGDRAVGELDGEGPHHREDVVVAAVEGQQAHRLQVDQHRIACRGVSQADQGRVRRRDACGLLCGQQRGVAGGRGATPQRGLLREGGERRDRRGRRGQVELDRGAGDADRFELREFLALLAGVGGHRAQRAVEQRQADGVGGGAQVSLQPCGFLARHRDAAGGLAPALLQHPAEADAGQHPGSEDRASGSEVAHRVAAVGGLGLLRLCGGVLGRRGRGGAGAVGRRVRGGGRCGSCGRRGRRSCGRCGRGSRGGDGRRSAGRGAARTGGGSVPVLPGHGGVRLCSRHRGAVGRQCESPTGLDVVGVGQALPARLGPVPVRVEELDVLVRGAEVLLGERGQRVTGPDGDRAGLALGGRARARHGGGAGHQEHPAGLDRPVGVEDQAVAHVAAVVEVGDLLPAFTRAELVLSNAPQALGGAGALHRVGGVLRARGLGGAGGGVAGDRRGR